MGQKGSTPVGEDGGDPGIVTVTSAEARHDPSGEAILAELRSLKRTVPLVPLEDQGAWQGLQAQMEGQARGVGGPDAVDEVFRAYETWAGKVVQGVAERQGEVHRKIDAVHSLTSQAFGQLSRDEAALRTGAADLALAPLIAEEAQGVQDALAAAREEVARLNRDLDALLGSAAQTLNPKP